MVLAGALTLACVCMWAAVVMARCHPGPRHRHRPSVASVRRIVNPAWPAQPDEWLDARPEYTQSLGVPNGPANKTGNVWRRRFGGDTGTYVGFNASNGRGLILWSSGDVQGDQAMLPLLSDDGSWVDRREAE